MSKIDIISLEDFLTYAQEANTRSTLAVEDGLKPVHRRILYSMYSSGVLSSKQSVKSAKIVGDVLGNYHPHGDSSVYDAAVRLSQPFKMRYPLISFKGNGGSILEPDSYAASRYTEMKLSPLGELLLNGIEKDTVPMVENYSGELLEPVILPSMVPNVLINGGMGIGVGISSSLLPHNLKEVCKAIAVMIDNKHITTKELMNYIPGPDFPTGGVITDAFSLAEIYESGRGTIKLRAKYRLETEGQRTVIVITEVPYLVNIENHIINTIKEMKQEGYEGVYNIVNASGKDGVQIRIVLEKGADVHATLEYLFEKTRLETTVKINQTVMLPNGTFHTLNLRSLILGYINHQDDIIKQKAQYDLDKAQKRLHVVDGLIIAAQNIDEVVRLIKASPNSATAKSALIKAFSLSDIQATAILDMKLARITSLEINKLTTEKKNLENTISTLEKIINDQKTRYTIMKNSLADLALKYGDARRTVIAEMSIIEKGRKLLIMVDKDNRFSSYDDADILEITNAIKGPKGSMSKYVDLIYTNSKDKICFVDANGKVYCEVVDILLRGDVVIGAPVVKMFKFIPKEFIIFVTEKGIIKKVTTPRFRAGGINSIRVKDDDRIVFAGMANDTDFIMVLSEEGKIANIQVSEYSAMNKMAYGSRGVDCKSVVSAAISTPDGLVLTYDDQNRAVLTAHSDFNIQGKGNKPAVIRDGVRGLWPIEEDEYIILLCEDRKPMKYAVSNIGVRKKNASGARITLSKLDKILS